METNWKFACFYWFFCFSAVWPYLTASAVAKNLSSLILILSWSYLVLSYLMSDFPWNSSDIPWNRYGNSVELPWNFLGNSVERYVRGLCYIIYMGSALPYDDKHDNEKRLIDCDSCGKRFLLYPDKIPTCNDCLQKPSERRQRSRNQTPIAFLFDE